MPNKETKKKALQPVYKPYLRGTTFGKTALRRGGRVLSYTLIFAFLYILAGTALSFNNPVWRVLFNALLVVACAAVLFNDGSVQGESDVAFAEIAHNRISEGKNVPASDRDRCFHPLKGFAAVLLGIAPILVIAIVFSLLAHQQTYTLGALPTWVSLYSAQPEIGQALAYYNEPTAVTLESVLRIVVRVLIFPYVNMIGAHNSHALYLADRLSPLLCLITPAFFGLGYLRGPRLRALLHGNIRLNHRRHSRREDVARRQRAQKTNKPTELV